MSKPTCAKCGSSMEEGYLLDRDHGGPKTGEWIEGAPERNFWGLKIKGREHRICTWRCTRCGYLESYAPDVREAP